MTAPISNEPTTHGYTTMRDATPGPVGQMARLFETIVAFARLCLCGIETVIAFAGEKWAFLVHFSGAVVMAVSAVPCWG